MLVKLKKTDRDSIRDTLRAIKLEHMPVEIVRADSDAAIVHITSTHDINVALGWIESNKPIWDTLTGACMLVNEVECARKRRRYFANRRTK